MSLSFTGGSLSEYTISEAPISGCPSTPIVPPISQAQSGIQRLINQATASLSLSQPNAWIENPLKRKEVSVIEEETLMQIMFEYYKKHF